jgi:hypothetical protein
MGSPGNDFSDRPERIVDDLLLGNRYSERTEPAPVALDRQRPGVCCLLGRLGGGWLRPLPWRRANSPFVLPNCIPAPKRSIHSWEPYLAKLRQLVAEAKQPSGHIPSAVPAPTPSAANRLRDLASLRESIISDDEFAAKKAELLNEL